MAWVDEVLPELRARLGDETSARYTDAQLKTLWLSAAKQVAADTVDRPFATAYAVSLAALTITPDPVLQDGTEGAVFASLATLKGACIANQGAAVRGAGQAIAIQSSSGDRIDLRDTAKARADMAKGGPCQEYQAALAAYFRSYDEARGGRLGVAVGTVVRVC